MIQVLSGSGELPFIVNFYVPGNAEHKWYHLILTIIIYCRYYSHFTGDETEFRYFDDSHRAKGWQSWDLNHSLSDYKAESVNHSLYCFVLGEMENRAGAAEI